MKFRHLLSAVLSASALHLAAAPLSLGDFDIIVKENFTLSGAHVHGSAAVGGNVILNGNMSEFGNQLSSGYSVTPALLVNGQVQQNADARINGPGTLQVGSLVSGQSVNASNDLVKGGRSLYANSVAIAASGIDFEESFDRFSLLSQSMAALANTVTLADVTGGDAQNKQLKLDFTANGAQQVLNLTAAEFIAFKNIQVGALGLNPNSWIINVDLAGYNGSAITQNRNAANDAAADRILWNFYGADALQIGNQFLGTVFAPDVVLTHLSNDLKGSVIAGSFIKLEGQVHIHTYDGDVPRHSVPENASTAFLALAALLPLAFLRARRR